MGDNGNIIFGVAWLNYVIIYVVYSDFAVINKMENCIPNEKLKMKVSALSSIQKCGV